MGKIPWNRIVQVIIDQFRRIQNRWWMREHRELVVIVLSLLDWMAKVAWVEWKMQTATPDLNRREGLERRRGK